MKRLYATPSVDEAQKLQELLKQAGIESSIDTRAGASVQTGAVNFALYIEDKDAPAAVGVLAAWLEKDLDVPDEPDLEVT
ncbi:MAG TPA: DUF2007 domain-containing protein [Planctomycetota bacterium]|nr:DUF2007 domain-containing protein [Planctomycetota bacterium]